MNCVETGVLYTYTKMKVLDTDVNAGRMKVILRKGYIFSATHRWIFGLTCVLILCYWIYSELYKLPLKTSSVLINLESKRKMLLMEYQGKSWNNYRKCIAGFNAKSVCLRQLEELCKNKTHRVLKVLRLSFSSFQPLMEINPKLKIVHLVRDPRAIIHSRLYSRFYPIERPRKNDSLERNICEKMLSDIKDVITLKTFYPGKVIVLYYEDLLENMHIRLTQIYNILNLTYNKEEIDTFSKINVNLSPPEMGNSFTKDRKHDNAFWWRLYTTWEEVQRIDKWCGEVYTILGYKQLTRKQLRDDSVHSYKVPSVFKL